MELKKFARFESPAGAICYRGLGGDRPSSVQHRSTQPSSGVSAPPEHLAIMSERDTKLQAQETGNGEDARSDEKEEAAVSGEVDEQAEEEAREKIRREREARAQALTLEIVGDLAYAEVKPPENVLFVCKLNPVTEGQTHRSCGLEAHIADTVCSNR